MKLDLKQLELFIDAEQINTQAVEALKANVALHRGTGAGNDFLGWVDLPKNIETSELNAIKEIAEEFRQKLDVVVVIGIGGSYLGAKAVLEALSHTFDHLQTERENPIVLFAGQNIGEDYLSELLDVLNNKEFGVVVISKSGTTTEPAIAFRVLKKELEDRKGVDEASKRIVAVTDRSKGALRQLSEQTDYRTFAIEDNIGGRYSVLTAVGLLPIAIAGFDIDRLLDGARQMHQQTNTEQRFDENIAAQYAVARNLLYQQGKKIEIMVNYNPKLQYFAEWWKQLFGESEGKENKGIFPANVNFTSDLHSMGQYIQEGERNLFETTISVQQTERSLQIPSDEANLDKLNYLAGKQMDEVNKMAELGTILAHNDGNVPNIRIEIDKIDAFSIGELIYFYEKACGISGYLLGVNPFDQPGVEAYKKNMFALLGKAGFEKEREALLKRI